MNKLAISETDSQAVHASQPSVPAPGLSFHGTPFVSPTLSHPAAAAPEAIGQQVDTVVSPCADARSAEDDSTVELARRDSAHRLRSSDVRSLVKAGHSPTSKQLQALVNRELRMTLLTAHRALVRAQTAVAHRGVDLMIAGAGLAPLSETAPGPVGARLRAESARHHAGAEPLTIEAGPSGAPRRTA